MTQDIGVTLNPGLLWRKWHWARIKAFFFHWQTGPKKDKLIKCYIWSTVLDVADTWTLWEPATPFKF